jgi:DNA-binding response OmpR family regulator
MKVLLVEDDELVRSTLVDMLVDAGFEVTEAASPEEALDGDGATEPPSILITDIDLGSSLNGFDVAAAAHRLWPAVSVLYISGLPSARKEQELSPRGGYLSKPFSGKSLLQTINELLRDKVVKGETATRTATTR